MVDGYVYPTHRSTIYWKMQIRYVHVGIVLFLSCCLLSEATIVPFMHWSCAIGVAAASASLTVSLPGNIVGI